uniref:Uncharacterized protein n=1 Tax=Rhizochromulina marina TaxID=1034831 RepID=A0A6U1C642_9STRA
MAEGGSSGAPAPRAASPFSGSSLMVFAVAYLAVAFVRDNCFGGDKSASQAPPLPPQAGAPSALPVEPRRKLGGEAEEFEGMDYVDQSRQGQVRSGAASMGAGELLDVPAVEGLHRSPQVLVQFCTS